ncbi:MAG: dTDP-4-dehydrorhamnose 3,5-epimerase [Legionellaceae bacterium]
MKITETKLPGVLLIEPQAFQDSRGFFFESYHYERYRQSGILLPFIQDNISRSTKNVLRGLHFQLQHTQGKLVGVTRGAVYDVAVDVRYGSPTFGQSVGYLLDDQKHCQLYIPPGFAHGFCVLSEEVDFYYKCTDIYHPPSEVGLLWNDPDLKIDWPVKDPILSEKDQRYLPLKDLTREQLPSYE